MALDGPQINQSNFGLVSGYTLSDLSLTKT